MGNVSVFFTIYLQSNESACKSMHFIRQEVFAAIQYRSILELPSKDTAQRTICSSLEHARQTISDTIQKANHLKLAEPQENMTDHWLEGFLFHEKQAITKGYLPVDWESETLAAQDRITGENLPVYLFVTSLPYSHPFYGDGSFLT